MLTVRSDWIPLWELDDHGTCSTGWPAVNVCPRTILGESWFMTSQIRISMDLWGLPSGKKKHGWMGNTHLVRWFWKLSIVINDWTILSCHVCWRPRRLCWTSQMQSPTKAFPGPMPCFYFFWGTLAVWSLDGLRNFDGQRGRNLDVRI